MNGQTFRQYDIGTRVINTGTALANQVPSGVYPGNGAMAVTATTGMNVQVAAGFCCVASSVSPLQGGYIFGLMSATTLTLPAASTTASRTDLVVAYINDVASSSSDCGVTLVTGTAGGGVPTAPASSLVLAQIAVGRGVSSVTSANITDKRSYVVAPGGILPISSAASAPAVPASQLMFNLSTGKLCQGTGAAGSVSALSVLKWTPQIAVVTSTATAGSAGALVTLASVSVTVGGSTDIEIFCKWPGLQGNSAYVTLSAVIDSTTVDSAFAVSTQGTSAPTGGGSFRYFTSSGQSNTPSAGTHTISFKFQAGGSGTSTSDAVFASASAPALLRVAPVTS